MHLSFSYCLRLNKGGVRSFHFDKKMSFHNNHFLDPIVFLALFQFIEMLAHFTYFFEFL